MKEPKTKIISFRVPVDLVERADELARQMPLGSRSKVFKNIFIPAFERAFKKQEKPVAVAAST